MATSQFVSDKEVAQITKSDKIAGVDEVVIKQNQTKPPVPPKAADEKVKPSKDVEKSNKKELKINISPPKGHKKTPSGIPHEIKTEYVGTDRVEGALGLDNASPLKSPDRKVSMSNSDSEEFIEIGKKGSSSHMDMTSPRGDLELNSTQSHNATSIKSGTKVIGVQPVKPDRADADNEELEKVTDKFSKSGASQNMFASLPQDDAKKNKKKGKKKKKTNNTGK